MEPYQNEFKKQTLRNALEEHPEIATLLNFEKELQDYLAKNPEILDDFLNALRYQNEQDFIDDQACKLLREAIEVRFSEDNTLELSKLNIAYHLNPSLIIKMEIVCNLTSCYSKLRNLEMFNKYFTISFDYYTSLKSVDKYDYDSFVSMVGRSADYLNSIYEYDNALYYLGKTLEKVKQFDKDTQVHQITNKIIDTYKLKKEPYPSEIGDLYYESYFRIPEKIRRVTITNHMGDFHDLNDL